MAVKERAEVSRTSTGVRVVAGDKAKQSKVVYRLAGAAGIEISQVVALDADARLDSATFAIGASANGATRASSVALIREAPAPTPSQSGCVVDFGRMVTVSGFSLEGGSMSVTNVHHWTGAEWARRELTVTQGSFPDVLTERLLVTSASKGDLVDQVVDHGAVMLPATPSSLELLVDGRTVWFERQGGTTGLSSDLAATTTYAVDRTEAIRESLSRVEPSEGERRVTVTLRAASPGALSLKPTISMLHEHRVTFGTNASSHTIDALAEGVHQVALGRPFAAGDRIREVSMMLRGSFGPERVEPVDGPPVDAAAELVLSGGRTVLFGVPAVLAEPFGELQGIRLRLTSPDGGEIAGRLLGVDQSGLPGDPLPGGEVAPLSIPAGTADWVTISSASPVPLSVPSGSPTQAPVALWMELVSTYGSVTCGLTHAASASAPGARILRRLPGGGTRPLTLLGPAADPRSTAYAALRVVGLPGRKELRPAVSLTVDTTSAPADPTDEDVAVVLGLGTGVAPASGEIPLSLRIAAPGTVTLADVNVAYLKGPSS